MKYRDPSIRACTSVNVPVVRRAPEAPKAPKVHTISGPKMPHPPIKVHDPVVDRMLPGGLPPEPYRTPWRRVGLTGRGAREPFNSRAVRAEFWATKRYLEG